MTERDLKDFILKDTYKTYRNNPKGQLGIPFTNFSGVTGVDIERVRRACKALSDVGYIKLSNILGDQTVTEITSEGCEYVEENLLSAEEAIQYGLAENKVEESNRVEIDLSNNNDSKVDSTDLFPAIYNVTEKEQKIFGELPSCFGVETLAEIFSEQINILAKSKDNFNMLGIFGRWGRGKTYFFNKLEDKLDKSKYEIIRFNAWKYQSTPAIWAYLYQTIYESLCWCEKIRYNIKRNLPIASIIIAAIPLLFSICLTNIKVIEDFLTTTFNDCAHVKTYVDLFVSILSLAITWIVNHYKNVITYLQRITKDISYTHVLGLQAEIENELESLLKYKISACSTRKLILFVDDIDRCPPEKIAEIVEYLRIIIDNEEIKKRLIVICSIDADKLKIGLNKKYGQLYDDKTELKKAVTEQIDKMFIAGVGLSSLDSQQIREFWNTLVKEGEISKGQEKKKKQTTEVDPIVSTGRLMGSFVTTLPEITEEFDTSKALEWVIQAKNSKDFKDIDFTPRKLKILYYRILFANNLIAKHEDMKITSSVIKEIIRRTMIGEPEMPDIEALSDVVDMVVPY